MLMKYKDFNQMSNDEMKNVSGGFRPGGGAYCEDECTCESGCNDTTTSCEAVQCEPGSASVVYKCVTV